MAKLALASEHRDFYRKHQYIEFDHFLSEKQLQQLNAIIESTLARRLGILQRQLMMQSPSALYQAGRDLWRSSEVLHKLVTQEKWARIAIELTETKSLRLGCDQFFFSLTTAPSRDPQDPYRQLLSRVQTLEETICFQGVVAGLMICLEGPMGEATGETAGEATGEATDEVTDEPISPFAQQAGNALFFSAQLPLNLSVNTGKHLLIVYTQPNAVYVSKQTDPNVHLLKQWGYTFGDKLSDKLNPILLR